MRVLMTFLDDNMHPVFLLAFELTSAAFGHDRSEAMLVAGRPTHRQAGSNHHNSSDPDPSDSNSSNVERKVPRIDADEVEHWSKSTVYRQQCHP